MLGRTEMDIRNGINFDIVIFWEVPCDDFKITQQSTTSVFSFFYPNQAYAKIALLVNNKQTATITAIHSRLICRSILAIDDSCTI